MTSRTPSITYLRQRSISDRPIRLCFFGMKHTGKSSLARSAAASLDIPWYDSDHLIASVLPEDMTLRDWYRREGILRFMELEYELTDRLCREQQNQSFSLSLGGGACENDRLMKLCSDEGILILLDAPAEALYNRIIPKGIPPFLDHRDPWGSFLKLYERRMNTYRSSCDVSVSLGEASLNRSEHYMCGQLPEIIARYYGRK